MKDVMNTDKGLPDLRQVLDPNFMAAAFEDFFRREYSSLGLKVSQCEVSRVYHKPGKECNITYRLRGSDGENRPYDQWFFANIALRARKPHKLQTAPSDGAGFWKPVSLWPEMNMLLHAFPYDPKLPYLGQLLNLDFVKQQVGQNLDGLGLSNGWRCEAVTVHKIKYRPAKRCVLRYELVMADAAGNQRPFVIYSKTYDNARSRYVYEVLQKICASPACTSGGLNIPGPIAQIESANTLWQHAWEGKKLAAVGKELGWINLSQSGLLPKIAALLAALHQIKTSDLLLQPGPSPAVVLENAQDDVANILRFLPGQQETLARITDALSVSTPGAGEPIPQATIHGTFKVAQLLYRDAPQERGQLALVDFDSIACGDPLFDAAELIASLVYLRISDEIPAASIAESVEIFLTHYQQHVRWTCERQRLAWYVAAFLLGKIHASLKRFETRAVGNISLALAVIQEWLDVAAARHG